MTRLVLVDVLHGLLDDDVAHVVAVLGVHEAAVLGTIHLAVRVVVGRGPSDAFSVKIGLASD